MRIPSELPGRAPSTRRRAVLIGAAVLAFVLFALSSSIAGFYTDYLWFQDLGVSSVYTGILKTKATLGLGLFAAATALIVTNLILADRLGATTPRRGLDEPAERYRDSIGSHAGKVRTAAAVLVGFALSSGVSSRWEDFILFSNQVTVGVKDPQFNKDVGFYMFDLPFRTFAVSWLAWALLASLVVSAAAHYLNGGIRFQPGASLDRVSAAAKAHLSVLAALAALVKAYAYHLERFQLNFSSRGFAQGAFYTDVKAKLPALSLLVLISIAAAVLLIANIWRRGAALPIVAIGSWVLVSVLVGTAYPASVQQFRVKPAESERERIYIDRNIAATRAAYGIDKVELKPIAYTDAPGALTGADLRVADSTVQNIRLWDPSDDISAETFSRQQSVRDYYKVSDVDVDRYVIDGKPTQVVIGARELNPAGLPRKNWVNRHLAYTHGFGVIMAPANSSTDDGAPAYIYKDLPTTPEIAQPRIYVGEEEAINDYAIVGTRQPEIDYQQNDGRDATSSYAGRRGVQLSSVLRRVAFALRFRELNVLISDFITPSSRVLYVRDVRQRLEKVAPFLTYDADPYPVILDGRIVWIVDGYTTSHHYPYAQPSDAFGNANYVRNSVKAVVDAYDGTVTLYAIDDSDPLLKVYRKAFPRLFADRSRIPSGIEAHFRYPEDLFKAQAALLGRYHITNAPEFFSSADGWAVSPDPGSKPAQGAPVTTAPVQRIFGSAPNTSTRNAIPPTYLLQQLPGDGDASFSLLAPFVPAASTANAKAQNLTAYLTARSDPGEYGRLVLYRLPTGQQINGPRLVASTIDADATVAQEVSLLSRSGSEVTFGNVLVVPVKESILFVRPLYVEATQNPVPSLERVVVVYGNRVVIKETLQGALVALFGESPETLEERPTTTPTIPGGKPGPPATADANDLIRQADAKLTEADAALKAGDLAGYARLVKEAQELVKRAAAAGGAPASTTTTTTAPPPATG